ncbi:MAG TPA: TetR family transcriptional regulator [Rhizomicrobium sp.]|nr:TetR family transcriptional regulator [Rhizomicrobium sp.]
MQTIEPEMMSHERSDARAAILKAARALAERDGVENLTLGKVAAEASLPRPVVFGQFVRKEDLLLCVAADSLATLARKMGGIEDVQQEVAAADDREGAVILTLQRAEAADAIIESGREISAAMGGAPDYAAGGSHAERRQSRRVDMTRLMESQMRGRSQDDGEDRSDESAAVASENAPEKSAPRAPDAWLERRLRVFERAMTAMEARQDQVEKDSRNLVVKAENEIKELESALGALVARVDESEAKQKSVVNELRMAIGEATLRLQTVEGVARAALVENEAPAFEHVPEEPVPVEPPQQVAIEAVVEDVAPPAHEPAEHAAHKSFLDSARASAIAAATVKAEAEAVARTPKKIDMRVRYILLGIAVGALFVVGAVLAFSQGVRDGRNEALRHTAAVPVQLSPAFAVADTPLDKLSQLARSGDANAQLEIANRYLDGEGTPRDAGAGFRWMTLAAKQRNAVAEYVLGTLYQSGVGTKADLVEATHWYEAAALQGNRKAMHDLAVAYAEGLGGVKSATEAVRWFSRAASLGYVDSQFNLAVLYERGDGVPQSLLDAYKWYAIAGAQGDAEAKARIDALRTQLSADDLAAAQHAADAFRAAQFDQAANVSPKI